MKPLLAGKVPDDLSKLDFPIYISPKLDGIRCLIINGEAVSRKLKPIPNKFIRDQLRGLPELDGELMINGDFNDVQSAVMSYTGEPDFTFKVFDSFTEPDKPFYLRSVRAETACVGNPRTQYLKHRSVISVEELMDFHKSYLHQDYEGTMVRDPKGTYKFGRSTTNQGILLKLKDFLDDEGVIVAVNERMHNGNEAKKDNLGRTERSSHRANLVGMFTLGSLELEYNGITFSVGTGLDDALRSKLWHNRGNLIGKKVTFKYQNLSKDGIPRFPVFLGIRYDL